MNDGMRKVYAARQNFIHCSVQRWLKQNNPIILAAIVAEADKRWPLPTKRSRDEQDYSFLEELK